MDIERFKFTNLDELYNMSTEKKSRIEHARYKLFIIYREILPEIKETDGKIKLVTFMYMEYFGGMRRSLLIDSYLLRYLSDCYKILLDEETRYYKILSKKSIKKFISNPLFDYNVINILCEFTETPLKIRANQIKN